MRRWRLEFKVGTRFYVVHAEAMRMTEAILDVLLKYPDADFERVYEIID